jgi:helix-turn-helix protein
LHSETAGAFIGKVAGICILACVVTHNPDCVEQETKSAKAVKCLRDIRGIPPKAYKLTTDGRQWRHLCEQRQRLMWLLATYADGDGTRIFPTAETLATSTGLSKRTIFTLLDDLKTCGFLETSGYHGERGARIRAINIAALKKAGMQSSVKPECNLDVAGVQSTEAGVQSTETGVNSSTSGVKSSIAHIPASGSAPPTDTRTDPLTASQAQNGRQPGDARIDKNASSTKQQWQDFIQRAQAFNLDNVMIYATPKPEEMEAVLKQLEMLGGDIELLADEIDDWVDMQSPPLHTLQYGRWTRWLEQSTGHIAELATAASRRKQVTRG